MALAAGRSMRSTGSEGRPRVSFDARQTEPGPKPVAIWPIMMPLRVARSAHWQPMLIVGPRIGPCAAPTARRINQAAGPCQLVPPSAQRAHR